MAAKHVEGRYAKLNDTPDKLVMAEADVDSIFLPFGSLFEGVFLDIPVDEEIVSIEMTKTGDVFSFTQDGESWTAAHGDESFNARGTKIDELIDMLDGLESVDIQLPDTRSNGATIGGYTITTDQGTVWKLAIEEQADGNYPVIVNDATTALMIDQRAFDKFFPDFASFEPKEGEVDGIVIEQPAAQVPIQLPADAHSHAHPHAHGPGTHVH